MKHTETFTSYYFEDHPDKYNLFGLSSILSDYGIENAVTKVIDKNEIHSIEVPIVAHTGNNFVIVEKIFEDEIRFIERDKRIKIPLDEFFKIWIGYILIADPDQNSGEPNYKIHFRKELFYYLQKIAILSVLVFLFAFAFITYKSYSQPGLILLLAISLDGIYICYLLLLKQLHVQNDYADRLCSLFKYNDCNNIFESDAAKLIGDYFQKNGEAKDNYCQWFEKGKFNKEEFFILYPIDIEEQEVVREFNLH